LSEKTLAALEAAMKEDGQGLGEGWEKDELFLS
jgi:hypothetical protein